MKRFPSWDGGGSANLPVTKRTCESPLSGLCTQLLCIEYSRVHFPQVNPGTSLPDVHNRNQLMQYFLPHTALSVV